jgi:hypothetical protein
LNTFTDKASIKDDEPPGFDRNPRLDQQAAGTGPGWSARTSL